jgi:uncharacterized protein YjbJ (UPF0337 family)
MNWDRIEGNWKQLKGNVQQHWGNLTDDQLEVTLGKRTKIAGQIQEIFGIARDKSKTASAWNSHQKNASV